MLFRAGAALTLALLLAHAWAYRFQCDDAFISFRYARNFAAGLGLVFNPGLERVEGYTNFLWVILLAALQRLGLRPEWSADVLSLGATVALWVCVVAFAARGERAANGLALVAPLLLAATRSVAVWSTSGLETRWFELLVLGGVLRAIVELEPVPAGRPPRRPLVGWLFGLAALTRPEGIFLGASVVLAAAWRRRIRGGALPWLAVTLPPFAGLVLAHFLFRRAYYGEWLPNTYFAKVGGHLRWDWGLSYLAAFALEYGLVLWVPWIAMGARRLVRSGRGDVPFLFAAVAGPLLVYVAAIGGDHFEYRPLDLLFPLGFLLVGEGFRDVARAPRARLAAALAGLALLYGVVDLPLRSHREFLRQYISGFPGLWTRESAIARDFMSPDRDPVLRFPGLRMIASEHQALLQRLTLHFVGIRQEEHRMFLEVSSTQGRLLRELVAQGVIAPDTRIGIDCVGAIPYLSDLLVLDRLGLTDAVVARRPSANPGMMAHEKNATLADGRRFGVELWAITPLDLVLPITSPWVPYAMTSPIHDSLAVCAALVGGDAILLCTVPAGLDRVAARMPALRLMSVSDSAFVRAYAARAVPALQELLRQAPDDLEGLNSLAYVLLAEGQADQALVAYREFARLRPQSADVWERIALCDRQLGRPADERAALERSQGLARAAGDDSLLTRVTERLRRIGAAR
jgi:arabinofuranosyltransferase